MKRNMLWFMIGAIASCITWIICIKAYVWLQDPPKDFRTKMESVYKQIPWLSDSRTRRFGGIVVSAPADGKNISALLYPHNAQYPQVLLQDENGDGLLNSVMIIDKRLQFIMAQDSEPDGIFDNYQFTKQTSSGGLQTYIDGNMDGQYEMRLNDGQIELMIESDWLPRESINGRFFVRLDGKAVEVVQGDGHWKVKGNLPPDAEN